ncbi:unnamed protein product, partial [Citrullus colocynthis]
HVDFHAEKQKKEKNKPLRSSSSPWPRVVAAVVARCLLPAMFCRQDQSLPVPHLVVGCVSSKSKSPLQVDLTECTICSSSTNFLPSSRDTRVSPIAQFGFTSYDHQPPL